MLFRMVYSIIAHLTSKTGFEMKEQHPIIGVVSAEQDSMFISCIFQGKDAACFFRNFGCTVQRKVL